MFVTQDIHFQRSTCVRRPCSAAKRITSASVTSMSATESSTARTSPMSKTVSTLLKLWLQPKYTHDMHACARLKCVDGEIAIKIWTLIFKKM